MQPPSSLTPPSTWHTNLSYEVTAEGIEDEATAKELKRLGCDIAQGYYFSPPLTVDVFERWLADSSTN
jgi:EAL domain-containing protein (putative c-di-GMP-specific phosphodiesterase class I)